MSKSWRMKGSATGQGSKGISQVVSYRRILGVFPGIVLPKPRRRVVRFVRVCTSMRVFACVSLYGCARLSLFQAVEFLHSPPPSSSLVLPSQPSTSPRLVSNDFPPSYPDSGTHPWGTASSPAPLPFSLFLSLPGTTANLLPSTPPLFRQAGAFT